MKRALIALVLFAATLAPTLQAAGSLLDRARGAVALLYSQDSSGGMRMHCTATAFERKGTSYLFATAAHCIGSDKGDKSADATNMPFYLTFDEAGDNKAFHRARVVFIGYQHRGEDVAVFEATSKENWPVIPIGDEKQETEGAAFLNVSSPLGLGKQVFHGTISSLFLDRPIVQDDINWGGTLVLQVTGINGGSSGSAIISEKQEAIVGFLVGVVGGSQIIAIPSSRFLAVAKAVAEGKYSYYVAPTAADGTVR